MNIMISTNSCDTIKALCTPAVNAGLIPESEFKEFLKLAKKEPEKNKGVITIPELELFTKKQAAAKLKLSVRMLDRYHASNLISYVKVGKRAQRIPSDSLYKFMQEGFNSNNRSNKNV